MLMDKAPEANFIKIIGLASTVAPPALFWSTRRCGTQNVCPARAPIPLLSNPVSAPKALAMSCPAPPHPLLPDPRTQRARCAASAPAAPVARSSLHHPDTPRPALARPHGTGYPAPAPPTPSAILAAACQGLASGRWLAAISFANRRRPPTTAHTRGRPRRSPTAYRRTQAPIAHGRSAIRPVCDRRR